MNNGDDAAHYLSKGYRVVAVEADPTLVDRARERFQEPVRTGQLELVNAAIGPKDEMAQFWVCDTKREWNSFDRNIASRDGLPHSSILVQCRPFRDLLRQYGTPFYLKVDIEGHDHYCVDDLDRGDLPQYLSLEMGPLETVFKLRDLGYERFKLITQNNHTCLAIDVFGTRERVKRQLRPYPALFRVGRRLSQMGQTLRRSLERSRPNRTIAGLQRFPPGSSGPFGEDTDANAPGSRVHVGGLPTRALSLWATESECVARRARRASPSVSATSVPTLQGFSEVENAAGTE